MVIYNNRHFKALANSENGEITDDTIFTYQQVGSIVTCSYQGKNILQGQLIALVAEDGSLDMRYHQVNTKGELRTGICLSTPEHLPDGRIRLHENWQWTSGDSSTGTSVLEEVLL